MPRHYYLLVECEGEARVYRYGCMAMRECAASAYSSLGMLCKPVSRRWMQDNAFVVTDFLTRAEWDGSAYYITRR